MARLNPDGGLDTSFSGDGIATGDASEPFSNIKAMALLPDGSAVLGGRDRRDAGTIQPATAAKHATRLRERMRTLCKGPKRNPANERLAGHLYRNLNHLFGFLRTPGIDATNWRAEQAIRPAVVNRKVWGGNRTWAGAAAQGILMSVLRTGWNKGLDMLSWLADLLKGANRPILGTAGG